MKRSRFARTFSAVMVSLSFIVNVAADIIPIPTNKTYCLAAEQVNENDFSFDASTGTITKYNGKVTDLIIPSQINGIDVTSIDSSALFQCDFLKSITLPDTITNLEYSVFDYLLNLTEIVVSPNNKYYSIDNGILFNKEKDVLIRYPRNKDGFEYAIPDSVKGIGYGAFSGCNFLESVIFPDSVTSIDGLSFAGSTLRSITIPKTVTSIGNCAFEYCADLKSVTICNGITEIPECAFMGCKSLTNVNLPDTVTSIGYGAFWECSALKNIKLPDSVKSIGESAFIGCSSLVNIIIPKSVTSICSSAFGSCSSLKSVFIPDSITAIESYAFAYCNELETVYYSGTMNDWNSITIEGFEPLPNAKIIYNSHLVNNGMHYNWSHDGNKAKSKPVLTVKNKVLSVEEARNQIVTVDFWLSGDNISSAHSVGLHIYCDDRLSFVKQEDGKYCVNGANQGTISFQLPNGDNGIVIADDLKIENGKWFSIDFKLPENVQDGDVFPIDIAYQYDDVKSDLFTNSNDTADGQLMQAWFFTKGTFSSDNPSTDPYLIKVSAEFADGYIAIDNGTSFITTTKRETTSTTSTTTLKSTISTSKSNTATSKSIFSQTTSSTTSQIKVLEKGNSYIIDTIGESSSNALINNKYSSINSYLFETDDQKLCRVEYNQDYIIIENYSPTGDVVLHKTLTPELPIWGGFFAGKDNYYFVYGQDNMEESDNVEVIRVVKYSKDWNRLSSCSISGANTYQPFKSGTLRIDETNGKLILYGSHTMYDDGDSLHHQSNMTFIIDENTMALYSSYYKLANINYGYVSHSFNQFVKTDGNTLYRVDLSDNHLRGVPITKADISSIDKCSYNNTFVDKGSYLKNGTLVGITLNGFELSDNNCIIAGCSIDQDASPWSAFGQRNIFIDIVDKDSLKSEVKWITNYNDNSKINVNCPVLIKQHNDLFAVMWEEIDSNNAISTKLVTVNSSGEILSNINKINVRLSDCQPIITSDGNITWYYTENSSPIFYSLNLNDYSEFRKEVNWNFDQSTSTLTISCDGMMPHYSANNQPWNQYNSEVETIILKSGIENISNNAFYGMKNLKNIVIPSTVKSIGGSAFNGCFVMKKIDLPNSITKVEDMAFYRCTNMLDITFDKNINSIGKYAFGYAWDMDRKPAIISNQVKIYGYEDTTAEKYALNNKIKFMPLNSITSTNTTTTTTSTTSTTTTTGSTTPTTTQPTINLGDVNNDNIVDARDASSVLREYAASSTETGGSFTDKQKKAADINGDNIVDARDASLILMFYAQASTENGEQSIENFIKKFK